jgi:hypothetical protein
MEGMNRIIGRGRDPDAASDAAAARLQQQRQAAITNEGARAAARRELLMQRNPNPTREDIDKYILDSIDYANQRSVTASPPLTPGPGGASVYNGPGSR